MSLVDAIPQTIKQIGAAEARGKAATGAIYGQTLADIGLEVDPVTAPTCLVDLDGTLALIDHRRPLIERPACPFCGWHKRCDHDLPLEQQGDLRGVRPKFTPDWDKFYTECVNDQPNIPVIKTLIWLFMFADIYIFSGRSDAVRKETAGWLHMHTELGMYDIGYQVRMRKATPGLEEEYKEHALRAGDRSYDNPPVRWLHVSLATIERTGHWEDKVLRVEEAARNAIASKGLESALQSVSVHSICALSAVTDTPVRIA